MSCPGTVVGEVPRRPPVVASAAPERRQRRRARIRRAGAFGLPLLLGAAAVLTGWTTPPRPWRQATGWDRLPMALRPTARRTPWEPGSAAGPPPRLTWLGHAGFLVEWEGTRLLLDPNSNRRCTLARRLLAERVEPATLGSVDAALVSHAHYDHLDLPTLSAVPRLGAVVVPRGSEGYLRSLPPSVARIGLSVGEARRFGALEVTAVPAVHNGHRFHPLASGHSAVGYVIRGSRGSLYFAGDTAWGPHLAEIRHRHHPTAALLPIGAYSPRLPLRHYHLSPEEAVRAAAELGVEVVVPMHFGTFRLSLDRPDAALPRFAAAAAREGVEWIMPALPSAPMEEAP